MQDQWCLRIRRRRYQKGKIPYKEKIDRLNDFGRTDMRPLNVGTLAGFDRLHQKTTLVIILSLFEKRTFGGSSVAEQLAVAQKPNTQRHAGITQLPTETSE